MALFRLFRSMITPPAVKPLAAEIVAPNPPLRRQTFRLCVINGGSSGCEEMELLALRSAWYDAERFGLQFVDSPRHAEVLLVTGPVTRNMEQVVRAAYEAAPAPCIVIAVGDGACTGGMWKDSAVVVGPVKRVLPVHGEIPGDPPDPTTILIQLVHILADL